jgi:hypothetical protein
MLDLLRKLGGLNACLLAFDRLLRRIAGGRMRLYKYYFVAQPVAKQPWLPPHRGAGVEIRSVKACDPALAQFPRPQAVFPRRFAQGALCLAAFKAGSCIGFLWFTLGPYQEDEVRCRYVPLPEGASAWDFDIYVHPEHRNSIAFLRLWDEANRLLAARGIRWSLSRISAFSKRSMSAHARLAAQRIGTAVFITLGSWQISVATVTPHFFVSRDPRSFPVFALHP